MAIIRCSEAAEVLNLNLCMSWDIVIAELLPGEPEASPLPGAGMRWAMNQGSCQAQMVLVWASPKALSFLTAVPGTWPNSCCFSGAVLGCPWQQSCPSNLAVRGIQFLRLPVPTNEHTVSGHGKVRNHTCTRP